jgi:hypothetical protein
MPIFIKMSPSLVLMMNEPPSLTYLARFSLSFLIGLSKVRRLKDLLNIFTDEGGAG